VRPGDSDKRGDSCLFGDWTVDVDGVRVTDWRINTDTAALQACARRWVYLLAGIITMRHERLEGGKAMVA